MTTTEIVEKAERTEAQPVAELKRPGMQDTRRRWIFILFGTLLLLVILAKVVVFRISSEPKAAVALKLQPQGNSRRRVAVSEQKPKHYSVSAVENLPASERAISEPDQRPRHYAASSVENLPASDSVAPEASVRRN